MDVHKVVISGGLGGGMISTLAQNTRDVGSTPAVSTIFPIFITTTTLVVMTNTSPVKAMHYTVWLLNFLCIYIYIYIYMCKLIAYMYVIVSIK